MQPPLHAIRAVLQRAPRHEHILRGGTQAQARGGGGVARTKIPHKRKPARAHGGALKAAGSAQVVVLQRGQRARSGRDGAGERGVVAVVVLAQSVFTRATKPCDLSCPSAVDD